MLDSVIELVEEFEQLETNENSNEFTSEELADKLSITNRKARELIRKLQKQGYVVWSGKNKRMQKINGVRQVVDCYKFTEKCNGESKTKRRSKKV